MAIRKLVRRAYPESGATLQEDYAVEQFKNALNDFELKRALFQGKPASLDEAVEIVAEAEAWGKAEKVGRSRTVIPEANNEDIRASSGLEAVTAMLRELLIVQRRDQNETKSKD